MEASADGYMSKEVWVHIANADVTRTITLEKVPAAVVVPTPPVDVGVVDRDRHLQLLKSGVVRDTRTGLEWYMGQDRDITHRNAARWVDTLTVDGGRWRLPSRDELETILEHGRGSRNMSTLFKTRGWFFWSADSALIPFDFSAGGQRWHQLKPASQSRVMAVRKP